MMITVLDVTIEYYRPVSQSTLNPCLTRSFPCHRASHAEDVKVRIESVDLDSNRMSLSMREGFGGGGAEREEMDGNGS